MVSVKGRESVNDVDFPQRIFQTSSKLCKVQLRYDSKLERLFVTGDLFGGLAAFSWKKFSLLRLLKLSKRLENVLFFFFFFKRKKSISTKIQSNAFSCNARKTRFVRCTGIPNLYRVTVVLTVCDKLCLNKLLD